jgi:two-component system, OmpR family, KDP operon response regulator KdpE
MLKVLLLGNDQQIINEVSFCLNFGFPDLTLSPTCNMNKVMELANASPLDLVIVDSTLFNINRINCPESIRQIREFSNAPLLILSKTETEIDRARGLEAGADEYINIPFNPLELLATCRALLRRSNQSSFVKSFTTIDKMTVDVDSKEVRVLGKTIKLTPIEYRLLLELIKNEGKILTHRAILENVWGKEYIDDHKFIKKYIYRLRTKLELDGQHKLITSVHGTGYKLNRQ